MAVGLVEDVGGVAMVVVVAVVHCEVGWIGGGRLWSGTSERLCSLVNTTCFDSDVTIKLHRKNIQSHNVYGC